MGRLAALRHLDHVVHGERGHGPGIGLHPERVLEAALRQVVGHRGEQEERRLGLLGVLAHGERHEARERADQRDRALVDQPLRFRLAQVDLVLRVAGEQGELGAAERLDAAPGIDLVHRELDPVERERGLEGERPRHGQDVADLDLARLGADDRGEGRDGRRRACRLEKIAPTRHIDMNEGHDMDLPWVRCADGEHYSSAKRRGSLASAPEAVNATRTDARGARVATTMSAAGALHAVRSAAALSEAVQRRDRVLRSMHRRAPYVSATCG